MLILCTQNQPLRIKNCPRSACAPEWQKEREISWKGGILIFRPISSQTWLEPRSWQVLVQAWTSQNRQCAGKLCTPGRLQPHFYAFQHLRALAICSAPRWHWLITPSNHSNIWLVYLYSPSQTILRFALSPIDRHGLIQISLLRCGSWKQDFFLLQMIPEVPEAQPYTNNILHGVFHMVKRTGAEALENCASLGYVSMSISRL